MPDRRNSDNERIEPPARVEETLRPFVWYISDYALEASIAGATITFSVILIVVWLINARFTVDQTDIQTAVQISAAIGSLSLAVPLFLKEFEVQETLWKSFLIISSIFLISTCVGFVAFLLLSSQEVVVKLTYVGFIIIVVSSRTFLALQRLWNAHKNKNQRTQDPTTNYIPVHIRPTKPLDFLLVLPLLLVCILTCNGWPAAFLLLFSYGVMLLFATLIGSIISIFTESKYKLKDVIQEVLEKNKEKVFSGQELLDALREGRYKGHNELISLHVIQIALNEMNSEYRENVPKATIWGYNQFIPRWNDCYNEEALKSTPSILVFENHYNNVIDILSKCKKEQGSKKLLDYISKKSNLSAELLKDGKILDRILQCLYLFNMDTVPGNDSEKLRRYLRDDLNISWAENAEIHKSDDGKTICIFKDENSAEITIGEEQEKAILKISDVRTHNLKVKSENGKLNIYQCFYEIYSPRSKDNEKYKIVYSEDCASQIRSTSQSPFNILLFDKIITNSQKRTWFYPEIDELTKLDLLIEFTEHLLNNPGAFDYYVKNNLEDVLKELPKTSPLIDKVEGIRGNKKFKKICNSAFDQKVGEVFEGGNQNNRDFFE